MVGAGKNDGARHAGGKEQRRWKNSRKRCTENGKEPAAKLESDASSRGALKRVALQLARHALVRFADRCMCCACQRRLVGLLLRAALYLANFSDGERDALLWVCLVIQKLPNVRRTAQ
jgi:hypothetical protein